MTPPKWFYPLIAACAIAVALAEVGYRAHTWNHWTLERAPNGVFNAATGVFCYRAYDGTHFCRNLVKGDRQAEAPKLPDSTNNRIAANVASMRSQGASDSEVEHYLRDIEGLKPR